MNAEDSAKLENQQYRGGLEKQPMGSVEHWVSHFCFVCETIDELFWANWLVSLSEYKEYGPISLYV